MVVVMGDEPERAQSEEQPTIWLRGLCGAELLARRKRQCHPASVTTQTKRFPLPAPIQKAPQHEELFWLW